MRPLAGWRRRLGFRRAFDADGLARANEKKHLGEPRAPPGRVQVLIPGGDVALKIEDPFGLRCLNPFLLPFLSVLACVGYPACFLLFSFSTCRLSSGFSRRPNCTTKVSLLVFPLFASGVPSSANGNRETQWRVSLGETGSASRRIVWCRCLLQSRAD